MERKVLPKCSPWVQTLTADRSVRHLTQQVPYRQENQWSRDRLAENCLRAGPPPQKNVTGRVCSN